MNSMGLCEQPFPLLWPLSLFARVSSPPHTGQLGPRVPCAAQRRLVGAAGWWALHGASLSPASWPRSPLGAPPGGSRAHRSVWTQFPIQLTPTFLSAGPSCPVLGSCGCHCPFCPFVPVLPRLWYPRSPLLSLPSSPFFRPFLGLTMSKAGL